MYKRIISSFLVISILVFPVFADDSYISQAHLGNFWDGAAFAALTYGEDHPFFGWLLGTDELFHSFASLGDITCELSEDHHHHGSAFSSERSSDGSSMILHCKCDYCGADFDIEKPYTELEESYQSSVSQLPASGVSSSGKLTVTGVHHAIFVSYNGNQFGCSHYPSLSHDCSRVDFGCDSFYIFVHGLDGETYPPNISLTYFFSTPAPISGSYKRLSTQSLYSVNGDGRTYSSNYSSSSGSYYSAGSEISDSVSANGQPLPFKHYYFYPPVYEVTPATPPNIISGDTYNIDNRAGSLTGIFAYGDVDVDGDLTVSPRIHIVNEGDSTVYNPVTNNTYDMSGWNYDYSSRTYEITTSSDESMTVTYGDEYITIKEGDTIYNVYYYITNNNPPVDPSSGDTSGILEWLREFKEWLSARFDDLISAIGLGSGDDVDIDITNNNFEITLPAEEEDEEEQTISILDIKDKFNWLYEVKEIGIAFRDEVTSNENNAYLLSAGLLGAAGDDDPPRSNPPNAPSIPIHLSAAQSHYGYQYGGDVEVLDLSWYAPYKQTVDSILSGFLWLLFLWGLWKNAPNIISGTGITANRLDDIDSGSKGGKKK